MKFESSFVFAAAKKYLPKGSIQRLFTKSTRLFNMWATNPKTSAIVARNPIDRIRILLNDLDDVGQGHISRAAIDYMAEPLGGCFANKVRVVSDKGTVEGEFVDVVSALTAVTDEAKEDLKDGSLDAEEMRRLAELIRKVQSEVCQLSDLLLNHEDYEDPNAASKNNPES